MNELELVDMMIERSFPSLDFKVYGTTSHEIVVMLEWYEPPEAVERLRALEGAEFLDYDKVIISRGGYFSCFRSDEGELVECYYLLDIADYLLVGESYNELCGSPEIFLVPEGAEDYIYAVLRFYRETGIALNRAIVESRGECLVIDDEEDPYFCRVFPRRELQLVESEGDLVLFYHPDEDVLISYNMRSGTSRTFVDIDNAAEFFNEVRILAHLPPDSQYNYLDEEERDLAAVYLSVPADRVALLNPYTLEVQAVATADGFYYPDERVRYDPDRRVFVWEDGYAQCCPPPRFRNL